MSHAAARIGPNERLSATMVLSAALIGVLILGIGFSREDPAPVLPTLDVILTPTRSEKPPEQADFIAQADNVGGGDRDKAQRPRDEQVAVQPLPEAGVAPELQLAQSPPPVPQSELRVLSTTDRDRRSVAAPEDQPEVEQRPHPPGRELIDQSLEIARLTAEIARQQELYAKRPIRKQISASTTEYVYASYMRSWVAKVERVGNLNYPDEARRRGLSGRLILTVSVRRDGSIEQVVVNEGSGKALLDAAALRTVRLAEPFPPLPDTEESVDILDITRTWEFSQGEVRSD
ncbi:MAG TPA: energy transducer TonB [Arenimonas sp.]|nr:energy transducer TonB [Arenimonas sp.]